MKKYLHILLLSLLALLPVESIADGLSCLTCGGGSSGGGTPGGTNGQTQYNSSGSFAGYTLGGTCGANQWMTALSSLGVTTCAQPAASNLSNGTTGSGAVVLATSPTLVTPALGTPASGVLTNATGLPISTGVSGLGTGIATFLGTPSSANLLAAMTTSTGTGNLVFATSPTLVTPALGTPASGVMTNVTGLPLTTGVTGVLPAANGGTGVNNTATLTLGSSNQNWATLGTGIVKNTTTTGALSNAVAADVTGLFSGCSGTLYLGADGACHSAAGGNLALGAGLTITPGTANATPAVPGSSTIYNQFFPNTYTGDHTITASESAGMSIMNSTAAHTFTLPQAGTTGFEAGTSYTFLNINTGLTTITTTTSVFNGVALTSSNIKLAQNGWAICASDGTNWNCTGNLTPPGGVYANGNSGTTMALNCDNGKVQSVTITGAVTFTFTTPKPGCEFTVLVTQDGTGHAYGFPAATIWPGGTAPTWSSAASAKDSASFKYDGSTFWGQGNTAYATSR